MVLETEVHPAIPLGASDLMGDRRQGFVRPAQILAVVAADRYAVLNHLPCPDQVGPAIGR